MCDTEEVPVPKGDIAKDGLGKGYYRRAEPLKGDGILKCYVCGEPLRDHDLTRPCIGVGEVAGSERVSQMPSGRRATRRNKQEKGTGR